MRNTFKYTVLYLMRSRDILIWALLFPVILSTLFFFMFGGLDETVYAEDIGLVIVQDDAWNSDDATAIREVVDAIGEPGSASDGEGRLVVATYVPDEDAAKEALSESDAVAYLVLEQDATPRFFMKLDPSNSLITTRQTIVKTVIDGTQRMQAALEGAMEGYAEQLEQDAQMQLAQPQMQAQLQAAQGQEAQPQTASGQTAQDQAAQGQTAQSQAQPQAQLQTQAQLQAALAARVDALVAQALDAADEEFTERVSLTQNEPTETERYYYALLGMATMFTASIGLVAASRARANTSEVGARRALGATSQARVLIATFLAAWLLSFLCLLVAFVYIRVVLGVSFGGKDVPCVAALGVSSLTACSLGALIGSVPGMPESGKNGIMMGVTCLLSLFAGLYGQACMTMADEVAAALPWTTLVNPARQVAQSFYSLYYYDGYERYFATLGVLGVMTVVFLVGTAVVSRRQQHEHL